MESNTGYAMIKTWGLILFFILGGLRSRVYCANYDYNDALGKAIMFFEGQRSGKLPVSQRVQWRGDSALSDGKTDKSEFARRVYYDAGDNVKFVWPMAFSVTLLSWAAVDFKIEISSAGEMAHLRGAIRWGTDFLLRAHTSPTTLYTQVLCRNLNSVHYKYTDE